MTYSSNRMMYFRSFLAYLRITWLQNNAQWIIALLYGDFWNYRNKVKKNRTKRPLRLYSSYTQRFNAFIGINAKFESAPVLPHGMCGIFISNSAVIGRDVIIFHHVTIGSNTIKDSKGYGAPKIEDGVLIGAGAKIIGNVTIGRNSRIGAGCVVTESVPPNSIVVMSHPRIIVKDILENNFVSNNGNLF